MGLFSFVGKALKGVVRGVTKVVKGVVVPVARGVASTVTHGLSEKVIQGVGLAKQSGLLSRPHPAYPTPVLRYDETMFKGVPPGKDVGLPVSSNPLPPGTVMSLSNPGNTPGRHNVPGGKSPHHHSVKNLIRAVSGKRKRRKSTAKKRTGTKRKRSGGKLKFGSPAYRRKYLGHR